MPVETPNGSAALMALVALASAALGKMLTMQEDASTQNPVDLMGSHAVKSEEASKSARILIWCATPSQGA